ncbi:nuclear hormone receptor FTZ-F1-like [Copidosoma floridanum]|nr:nuclear hormone receptor FTZ-F1-like [Copidosoma floridanum]XP_023247870.1 nuclear hormone receptor FTZ-F1-like [Copidosoma floridanum]
MKDKRQRLSIWPYPLYADPQLTSALLAASMTIPGYSPITPPGPSHYGPTYATAAYYAARFSPYGATPLSHHHHRPHAHHGYAAAHPHLLTAPGPHHPTVASLPPLHLSGLGTMQPAQQQQASYVGPTVSSASQIYTNNVLPSSQMSPQSDASTSSDCDYNGNITVSSATSCATTTTSPSNNNNNIDKRLVAPVPCKPSVPAALHFSPDKMPISQAVAAFYSNIMMPENNNNNNNSSSSRYYHHIPASYRTPSISPTSDIKIKSSPKLFQPYKNDDVLTAAE